MRRFLRCLKKAFLIAVNLILLSVLLTRSAVDTSSISVRVNPYTTGFEFNFINWTIKAAWERLEQFALGTSGYMNPDDRSALVISYLQVLGGVRAAEGEIRRIYSDPAIQDPEAESAEYREALDQLVWGRDYIGPTAESIVQGQVSVIVHEMGLAFAGQPLPPVLFRVSDLPLALILSPRSEIKQVGDFSLDPDLPLEEQIRIEDQVFRGMDLSPLVVPVGGVGTYPTMIMATTDINYFASVVCHEWIHNYLTVHPLGISYLRTPQLRIMNETAAAIAGDEMGRELIEMFYPEYLPEEPQPVAETTPSQPQEAPIEPVFSYNHEMYITRVAVEEMLAAGEIEAAEAYMEERRVFIWDNGYRIRKLNQAFFAFYGGYADSPVSAAGEDPVGAAVRALRAHSDSLEEFVETMSWMWKFSQLQAKVSTPDP